MLKIVTAVFALILASHLAFGQSAAKATSVEEVYLAADDGSGHAGEPVSEFTTDNVPIYCVVVLDRPAAALVKMNFVAVNVPGVKPETKVVESSFKTAANQNRVNFTGRPYDRWVPGQYRVDIFLDGQMVKSVGLLMRSTSSSGMPFAPKKEAKKPRKKP